jgi:cytochrome P450
MTVHGLVRFAVARSARSGEFTARLMADPELRADPYPAYERVRTAGPFLPGRLVTATARHDVCTAVLRSHDFGVQGRRGNASAPVRLLSRIGGRGPTPPGEPPSLLGLDAPAHTRIRKLVTRAFSARAIEALRERTRAIAEDLLDDLAADETVDLVPRYASLLPVTVISEMLAVPAEMREQFLAWGDEAALSLDMGLSLSDFRRSEAGMCALEAWMSEHIARLRRDPGHDVLSTLARAQADRGGDEKALAPEEVLAAADLLLAAGFETTVNLLSNGASLLMAHPEQLEILHADPGGWSRAVEEILRYDSPVQRTSRIAGRDTEVAGVPLRAGSVVLALLGGANRDPEIFPEPDAFDVTRSNAAEHLSFSSGPHYCLGAALARMEGEIGLRTLFERFPEITPTGNPRRRGTGTLRGYRSLPVRLGANRCEAASDAAGESSGRRTSV